MIDTEIKPPAQGASCVQRLEWIAAVARDGSLPASACRVAVAIAGYVNNARGGIAWPTQERLAGDLKASVDTVRRAVNALVAAGHLTVEGGGRKGQAMTYRLANHPSNSARYSEGEPSNSAAENLAEMQGTTSQNCHPKSFNEPNYLNPSISLSSIEEKSECRADDLFEEIKPRGEIEIIAPNRAGKTKSTPARVTQLSGAADDAFAEFWRAYPRREAKAAAQKAFQAALKAGGDAEAIIAGARRYANLRAGEPDPDARHRYTALPASWLRNERWLDEAPAPSGGLVLDGATGAPIPQPMPRPAGKAVAVDVFAFGAAYAASMEAA